MTPTVRWDHAAGSLCVGPPRSCAPPGPVCARTMVLESCGTPPTDWRVFHDHLVVRRMQPGELRVPLVCPVCSSSVACRTREGQRKGTAREDCQAPLRAVRLFASYTKKQFTEIGRVPDEIPEPAGKVLLRQGDMGRQPRHRRHRRHGGARIEACRPSNGQCSRRDPGRVTADG